MAGKQVRDQISIRAFNEYPHVVGKRYKGKRYKGKRYKGKRYKGKNPKTICVLPDNVLLKIFDFYRMNDLPVSVNSYHNVYWMFQPLYGHDEDYWFQLRDCPYPVWRWHGLVHICRRWRQIIFSSPSRLDLQIFCSSENPVRNCLDCWPALPLAIYHFKTDDQPYLWCNDSESTLDNVMAALEEPDRVRQITLVTSSPRVGAIIPVMQRPFPVLTHLKLGFGLPIRSVPVLPNDFLSGSAPSLQGIYLNGIPFPTLPTLLFSTPNLIHLELVDIPSYISPEAMAACVAALPKLVSLIIEFGDKFGLRTTQSSPADRQGIHLDPPTQIFLPSLTQFRFQGMSKYLEDFLVQIIIDAPRLNFIRVNYFDFPGYVFQVSRCLRFICHTGSPQLSQFKLARLYCGKECIPINFCRDMGRNPEIHVQLCVRASMIQPLLSQCSALLSDVVHLFIGQWEKRLPMWVEDMKDAEWLALLSLFTVVETMHVSSSLAKHIAVVLNNLTGEMDSEVLPALHLLCLEGFLYSEINSYKKKKPQVYLSCDFSCDKFAASRQLSGRPVTIVYREGEFYQKLVAH